MTQEPGWPQGLEAGTLFDVEVAGRGTIKAAAGEPLMSSLERNGFAVSAVCRSGECSYCRSKLIAGRVFMPESAAVRESDRIYRYIHPCVSYPLEDLVIRLEG